ncbi:MAG: Cas10/Cmr2 second palm domain-containing protein [Cyanobacteriota bacterium]
MTYSVVTFAPVQSFIRASRKLRDLYGSSLLLSHLAKALADDAAGRGLAVISPASVQGSRGVPNVLVIAGDYRKGHARDALLASWKGVLQVCRQWLEKVMPETDFDWDSSWKACAQHTWELFHGQGATIAEARRALAVNKLQRAWSVPNWTGESSSLSSAEAVVWPRMGQVIDPRHLDHQAAQSEARQFLQVLRQSLGQAFAGEKEELSLNELVKRLVTYKPIAEKLDLQIPEHFDKTSMLTTADNDTSESIIWFMADGDSIGAHLETMAGKRGEAEALQSFSAGMRAWAADLYQQVPAVMNDKALVVYAVGDDVFGALHESLPGRRDLTAADLWRWLAEFPRLWQGCGQENLTVSMGLVWADSKVPQREALQHARDAEASAKARGRNRFALRLLYANGNHLEWTCPWSWLEPIRSHYRDREGRGGERANWRHLADDLAWLRSRQAIASNPRAPSTTSATAIATQNTALALWQAYFPGCSLSPERDRTAPESTAFRATLQTPEEGGRRFDQWLHDLGRVLAAVEKWNIGSAIKEFAR